MFALYCFVLLLPFERGLLQKKIYTVEAAIAIIFIILLLQCTDSGIRSMIADGDYSDCQEYAADAIKAVSSVVNPIIDGKIYDTLTV